MSRPSVKVPSEMGPLFEQAEKYVKQYFSLKKEDPAQGIITVDGERYILVRASSCSVHFFEFIKMMYPALTENEAIEATGVVLFDMAHNFGRQDAIHFHKKANVVDPIAKLSTGPIHFAYTGWAFVEIHADSVPAPDENFYLHYDHPQSFEADSWINLGKKTTHCTCYMNAGYSSGWCEVSFGIKLVAKEVSCRAKGDSHCRFIMAPPEKINERLENYKRK